jgi:hypothetical protein
MHSLALIWPENSEGSSPGNRWKRNQTIGPIVNRPGRQGIVPPMNIMKDMD